MRGSGYHPGSRGSARGCHQAARASYWPQPWSAPGWLPPTLLLWRLPQVGFTVAPRAPPLGHLPLPRALSPLGPSQALSWAHTHTRLRLPCPLLKALPGPGTHTHSCHTHTHTHTFRLPCPYSQVLPVGEPKRGSHLWEARPSFNSPAPRAAALHSGSRFFLKAERRKHTHPLSPCRAGSSPSVLSEQRLTS